MKKAAYFLLSILIISANLTSQESGYFDGKDWGKFTGAGWMVKAGYLRGLQEGQATQMNIIAGFLFLLDKEKAVDNLLKLGDISKLNPYTIDLAPVNIEQLITGIDELYKDYANQHIPIFAIATLVKKRIAGEIREEDIGPRLQKLRAFSFAY